MPLDEADTRAQLIDPKLKAAGWTDSRITREHVYRRDHRYTAGRTCLAGDEARRQSAAFSWTTCSSGCTPHERAAAGNRGDQIRS
jgi:hypothetical protein